MWSLFKKNRKPEDSREVVRDFSFLGSDMHSHLIAGVDDGAPTLEESLNLVRGLKELGYSKLITTPHVIGEFYPNTKEKLQEGHRQLQRFLADNHIRIPVELAAEYFLDNYFLAEVLPHGLLSFGDNYVLVEVSMAGWPRNIDDILFNIQSLGYKPILAHPERYVFEDKAETFLRLKERGIKMQLNLLSVTGYYNKIIKVNADNYLKAGLYDFCGSDTHHARHVAKIGNMRQDMQEVLSRLYSYEGFLNRTL